MYSFYICIYICIYIHIYIYIFIYIYILFLYFDTFSVSAAFCSPLSLLLPFRAPALLYVYACMRCSNNCMVVETRFLTVSSTLKNYFLG